MSNKKTNPKRNPGAKETGKRKKEFRFTKKTAAVLLAVIAVLAGLTVLTVKVIAPRIEARKNDEYRMVSYRGGKIPKKYYDYLVLAENDTAKLCEESGPAVVIDDWEISAAEFDIAYYDEYAELLTEAASDITHFNVNTKDFPVKKHPEKVRRSDGTLWSDYILEKAKKEIRETYYFFDKAVEECIVPNEDQKAQVEYHIDLVESYEKYYEGGRKELLENSYNKELTFNIFAAYSIKLEYASLYKQLKKDEIIEKTTQKEVDEKISGREYQYMQNVGRLCPVPSGAADYSSIKTEQDYLDYCNSIHGGNGDFDAEKETDISYSLYSNISKNLSDDLIKYIYSPDRKAGEVSLYSGSDGDYLVYTEEPGHYETSKNAVVYYQSYNTEDEEEKAHLKESFNSTLKEWENDYEKSEEGLIYICDYSGDPGLGMPYGDTLLRSGSFDRTIDRWFAEPGRKEGDYTVFDNGVVFAIIYYKGENTKDTDDMYYISREIADERFDSEYLPGEGVYELKVDEDIISGIPEMSYDAIESKLSKIGT